MTVAERLRRGLAIGFITICATIVCLGLTPLTHPFRHLGYEWFISQRAHILTPLLERLTLIGDPPWFLPVGIGLGAGVAVATRRLSAIILPTVAVPLCRTIQELDRLIFHSGAPPQVNAVGEVGGSPSGGAFRAVVLWGLAAWFIWQAVPHRRWVARTLIAIPTAVALTEGYTRLYLGRHWPVDVLVGYIAGAVLLAGLIKVDRVAGVFDPVTYRNPGSIAGLHALGLGFVVSAGLAVAVLKLRVDSALVIGAWSGVAALCAFLLLKWGQPEDHRGGRLRRSHSAIGR